LLTDETIEFMMQSYQPIEAEAIPDVAMTINIVSKRKA
jgi:hypothetical protein